MIGARSAQSAAPEGRRKLMEMWIGIALIVIATLEIILIIRAVTANTPTA